MDIDGRGVILIAPTGTGKTTHAFKLVQLPGSRILGDDWVYVTHPKEGAGGDKGSLVATQPERSLYLRTEDEREFRWLRAVFDRCMCENVIMRKEDCEKPLCRDGCKEGRRRCVFDEGKRWCYYGFGNSRAMVRREWLWGREKVADRTKVSLVVLLERVPEKPPEERLGPDEAIEVLRKGKYTVQPGAGPKEDWGRVSYEPWYNPYLYPIDVDDKIQEHYFYRLFSEFKIPCIKLNTAVQAIESTHKRILRVLKGR